MDTNIYVTVRLFTICMANTGAVYNKTAIKWSTEREIEIKSNQLNSDFVNYTINFAIGYQLNEG